MTQARRRPTRSRITFESIHTFRRARWALLLLLVALACEERFTGVENEASGGAGAGAGASASGGSSAGTSGSGGTTAGSTSSGGTGGTSGGGGSDAGAPSTGGTPSGGTSGGSDALGGQGGEPGEVEPEIPTDGLMLWLRADRGVTSEEGIVSKWEDGSGEGNHATQTANNVRPTLVTEAFGARPAIAFGDEHFLRLPAGFSDFSAGFSAFGLLSFDETSTCTAMFHLGNGPEVNDIEIGHVNGAYQYEVADEYRQGSVFDFGEPALLAVVHRPTTSVEMRWNQNLEADPIVMLPAAVERTDNVVGRSLYVLCGGMKGKLAELILYKRAVSDEELVDIEQYLQQRYECCSG